MYEVRIARMGWLFALLLALSSGAAFAETDRSIVAVVGAGSSADSGSQISKQVIEECVMQIPTVDQLAPVVEASTKFVKAIGGDMNRNESVRQYTAVIEFTYVVRQKQLVVVTTQSVEAVEPVFREVSGRFDKSIRFVSNPANGDAFGGQDPVREYYFSSEQAAIDDASQRAAAWLKQKTSVMCSG